MIAVAEAARNIVCSGGEPLGVTNCLNFGNPYDPEVYYQFVQAIKGMGAACVKFNTPVTGGNVSFYNQNPEGPVYPTPTIGMVGLVEDISKKMTLDFKSEGDIIYIIGRSTNDISSSEYLHNILGAEYSPAPYFDIDEEYALQQKITELIKNESILSAHDISEGGLFVTLCEAGFNRNKGFAITTDNTIRKDAYLFGEAQSRVIISVAPEKVAEVEGILGNHPYQKIGTVTNSEVTIDGENWGTIGQWKERYDTAIESIIGQHEEEYALSDL